MKERKKKVREAGRKEGKKGKKKGKKEEGREALSFQVFVPYQKETF